AAIIRVDPDTGAATSVMPVPRGLGELTRLDPYFSAFLDRPDHVDLVRYDPAASALTVVTTVFTGDTALGGVGDLVAAADGLLYYQSSDWSIPQARRAPLYRLHPVTATILEVALPPPPVPSEYTDVHATVDGRVFVRVLQAPAARVDSLEIATGAVRTVCELGQTGAGVGGLATDGPMVITVSR